MPDFLDDPDVRVGAGGVTADSLAADLAREHQERIDRILSTSMYRESELGAFALEDVLELGKHVI